MSGIRKYIPKASEIQLLIHALTPTGFIWSATEGQAWIGNEVARFYVDVDIFPRLTLS